MDEEIIYDYAKPLVAPYWIQELAVNTKKGRQVIWTFSVPMQLSYFVVFILSLLLMVVPFWWFWLLLSKVTFQCSWLLLVLIPNKLGRFYSEYEPQGKKMFMFLLDYVIFLWNFTFDKKMIYQGERQEKIDELVFEKTEL